MPDPSVPIRGIPQFEFHGEGIFFDPETCNHDTVQDGTPEAEASELVVNGITEDHLLPPHALFPETFSEDLLLAERAAATILGSVSVAASNPKYEGPSYEDVRKRSEAEGSELNRRLAGLRSNPKAYMKLVREIGNDVYHISSNSTLPNNTKLAKGLKHGWKTEGIVLAPNTVAGLGDVCPFRSPLCTINCLNLSGKAEMSGFEGEVMNCRRRRTLMFMHAQEAFMAQVASLIDLRAEKMPGRYAVRPNVMSDLVWEKLKFYNPWSGESNTLLEVFPNVKFYDYTKNCERYSDWLNGDLPSNYYLTFSMSEINALYALHALARGGAVTVIFDALPEHTGGYAHVRYPAEPIPDSFCGFPVVDGDQTDLRFEDRERFGIPNNQGFVVGLRLKGTKHRREYNLDKASAAGFIFDAKREYGPDYARELVAGSERRRLLALRGRARRPELPGAWKQRFVGIPGKLVAEAKREYVLLPEEPERAGNPSDAIVLPRDGYEIWFKDAFGKKWTIVHTGEVFFIGQEKDGGFEASVAADPKTAIAKAQRIYTTGKLVGDTVMM